MAEGDSIARQECSWYLGHRSEASIKHFSAFPASEHMGRVLQFDMISCLSYICVLHAALLIEIHKLA